VKIFEELPMSESKLDPNDPVLTQPAPHERVGILRAHRAGWTGRQLTKVFNFPEVTLLREMARAIQPEGVAYNAGLPMHDANLPKGTK